MPTGPRSSFDWRELLGEFGLLLLVLAVGVLIRKVTGWRHDSLEFLATVIVVSAMLVAIWVYVRFWQKPPTPPFTK